MSTIFKTTLALAGIALAHAECTTDDAKETTECWEKLGSPPQSQTAEELKKSCTYVQDYGKCVTGACCDDKDIKDALDLMEKGYEQAAEILGDEDLKCEVECAGSMLAPGVAALTAAVVALKLM